MPWFKVEAGIFALLFNNAILVFANLLTPRFCYFVRYVYIYKTSNLIFVNKYQHGEHFHNVDSSSSVLIRNWYKIMTHVKKIVVEPLTKYLYLFIITLVNWLMEVEVDCKISIICCSRRWLTRCGYQMWNKKYMYTCSPRLMFAMSDQIIKYLDTKTCIIQQIYLSSHVIFIVGSANLICHVRHCTVEWLSTSVESARGRKCPINRRLYLVAACVN